VGYHRPAVDGWKYRVVTVTGKLHARRAMPG